MATLLDYDPLRGLEQWEDRTQDGRLQIHYRQDVEPVLELAKIERDGGMADKAGKKQDIFLYARIPNTVQLEMKHKYGLDMNNKNHLKRIFELINSDYPYCKTTNKKHFLKR